MRSHGHVKRRKLLKNQGKHNTNFSPRNHQSLLQLYSCPWRRILSLDVTFLIIHEASNRYILPHFTGWYFHRNCFLGVIVLRNRGMDKGYRCVVLGQSWPWPYLSSTLPLSTEHTSRHARKKGRRGSDGRGRSRRKMWGKVCNFPGWVLPETKLVPLPVGAERGQVSYNFDFVLLKQLMTEIVTRGVTP